MATAPVDHGMLNRLTRSATLETPTLTTPTVTDATITRATINLTLDGSAIGTGSFTADADAQTSVSTSMNLLTNYVIFPTNAAAGLLLRTKTCYVSPGINLFTFNVSASGAGAPAGTETFDWLGLDAS